MSEQLFEWDEDKDRRNQLKHGVSFAEAKTVFNDPFALTIPDLAHSREEVHWLDVGASARGKLLVVWYTERDANIRIIGCRNATKAERRLYEDERI